jgi:hypothetical protein
MTETLDRLHTAANRRPDRFAANWYAAMQERWAAYQAYAREVAAQLPFAWHVVACDNPTQNHTGATNGRSHIVCDAPVDMGRLHRAAGDGLCGQNSPNMWCNATEITCKRCLVVAERIIARKGESRS